MDRTKAWLNTAIASLVAFWLEGWIGFGLAFSPGWANGWPGGLSIHVVWSTGMSLLLGLAFITMAVGIGAAVAAACSRRGQSPRMILAGFAAWLLLSMVLALPAASLAFGRFHASAVEMWPGGYHPAADGPAPN